MHFFHRFNPHAVPHAGRDLHRVHGRVLERVPRDADPAQLVPPGVLQYHERRRHVHLVDVREGRSRLVLALPPFFLFFKKKLLIELRPFQMSCFVGQGTHARID